MKTKHPLILMELVVMLLVFMLAAALCMKAFAWSQVTSGQLEERSRSALQVQNVAETVKACRGDFDKCREILGGIRGEDGCLQLYFDGNWEAADGEEGVFCLTCRKTDSGNPLLGSACITAAKAGGESIFELDVCWQEETQ